jgi:hypothetical protein
MLDRSGTHTGTVRGTSALDMVSAVSGQWPAVAQPRGLATGLSNFGCLPPTEVRGED